MSDIVFTTEVPFKNIVSLKFIFIVFGNIPAGNFLIKQELLHKIQIKCFSVNEYIYRITKNEKFKYIRCPILITYRNIPDKNFFVIRWLGKDIKRFQRCNISTYWDTLVKTQPISPSTAWLGANRWTPKKYLHALRCSKVLLT